MLASHHRMQAHWLRALIVGLVLASSFLSSGCASIDQAKNDKSVQDFLTASNQLATIKALWITSDADLLAATCRRLTPKLRRRLGASTSEYDSRRTTCDGIEAIRASIPKMSAAASEATDGTSIEAAQSDLDRERQLIDQSVQTFPTSAFLESNFPSGPSADYRTKHESFAVDSGKIAVRFVDIARAASDYALQQAQQSSHQLDKSRAALADENYTKASVKLKNLGSTTSPSEILTQVGEILTIVDYVLGSAQSTNKNATNPITGAHEDLPSAASPVPTVTPTNTPTPEPPPVRSLSEKQSTNASIQALNGVTDFENMVQHTRQMSVVGVSSSCVSPTGILIRFKDDGSGGCADLGHASKDSLDSGVNIALIPVNAEGRGTVFALLYVYGASGPVFVGILPGDGSGNLSVHVEGGVIVEQNGNVIKRSTYRDGRVIPA